MSKSFYHTALAILFSISIISSVSNASTYKEEAGFFRFPDVRGDLVVFTSEGDLWSASLTGKGYAVRLTRHDGEESYARISPDGRWIAFSGEYDGNGDVYVIPSTGGAPKRLTYHGGWDEVVAWTGDSKRVLFRSTRNSSHWTWKIFSVSIEGGFPEDFGLDKGTRISFEPDGDRIAFTRLRREVSSWKRYKGGRAMDIWVGNLKTNKFEKATRYNGTDAFPMWYGDRIFFLSDTSGRANLTSMLPDGSDWKQHTFDEKWDVRWPSGDGKTIVYQKAMDIWAYDIESGKSHMLDIKLPSDRIRLRERVVDPSEYIDGHSIPDEGRRIAVAARGEVFTFPVEKPGYIRQLTHTPDARDKSAKFSPDGKRVAILSDASGEDEIWLYSSDGKGKPEQLTKDGDMYRYWIGWSPDSKMLALADKANRLWLVDAESGKQTLIHDAEEYIWSFDWSPDSKWIAFIPGDENENSDVYLYNIADKKHTRLSTPMINEVDVSWDPEGKYLYLIVNNWFNPYLSMTGSSYVYNKGRKIYVMILSEDTENPFEPKLVEAFEDEKDEDEDKDEKKDDEDKGVKVEINLDELQDRIFPVKVDAGNYFGLSAVKGKLYFGSWENNGMLMDGEWPKGFQLNCFDIDDEEVKVVSSSINGYRFSADRKKMLVVKQKSFIVMDAGATEIPDEDGHVDMSGWSMKIDPQREWGQIIREVWRRQRDFFYDPNLHGVDWKAVWKQYSKLLPRITNRDDLNDLIREMLGELNVGHAYIVGGDIKKPRHIGTGSLGADLEPTKQGPYRISRILRGDSWGDEPVSPLASAVSKAKAGEYIVALNNIPLEPGDNIHELLFDKGGKEILLSLNDKPTLKDAREVPVKPLGGEGSLRYFDWVRDRREYVDRISGGKVGYVHLPDMSSMGLSMWGRMYFQQANKEALLIDVRYNHGGFVADMILSTLGRKLWARAKGREGPIESRPTAAFHGPMVTVCNHETASDGETFSEGFKRLGLGELIGTRTWGGWVGVYGFRPLADHGFGTVPQFTGWGAFDGNWLIEGPGVSPTIEVVDEPAKMIMGQDPQLEAAVKHLLEKLEDWPKPADLPPYPRKPLKIRHIK